MNDKMSYFSGDWEDDCDVMRNILDCVEFKSGTARRKMYKQKAGTGGSMLFGLTWRGYLSPSKSRTKSGYKGLYKTKVMDDHPELEDIFKEFSSYHFPNFKWSQVQMNRNFKCGRHKDSTNVGESVLCAFGNYEGGDTFVDYENITLGYDARLQPVTSDRDWETDMN